MADTNTVIAPGISITVPCPRCRRDAGDDGRVVLTLVVCDGANMHLKLNANGVITIGPCDKDGEASSLLSEHGDTSVVRTHCTAPGCLWDPEDEPLAEDIRRGLVLHASQVLLSVFGPLVRLNSALREAAGWVSDNFDPQGLSVRQPMTGGRD